MLYTSGFTDNVMFSYHGINGPESSMMFLEEFGRWQYQLDVRQLQCLVQFVRMWHWGQSLLSGIALFGNGNDLCSISDFCSIIAQQWQCPILPRDL